MDLYAIYLVSDSVGETADVVIRSALYQFETENYQLKKYSYVQTLEEIDDICAKASEEGKAMIFYTFVKKEMADHMKERIEQAKLIGVDIYSPILTGLGQLFQLPAKEKPGINRQLNQDYFNRVEAIEFSVKYDDGRDPRGIEKADIVLVGVSRTSKTPLSIYLANKNVKVANIPLFPESKPPKEIFTIAPERIIGLVNSPKKTQRSPQRAPEDTGTAALRQLCRHGAHPRGTRICRQNHETDRLRNRRRFEQSDRRNRRPHPALHGYHEYQPQTPINSHKEEKYMTKQWVYRFSEGKKEQKMLLGGKGANLAEMTNLGLPIPPGFTITTESCIHYFDEGRTLWAALKQQIDSALIDLENAVGKSFRNPANPLLVSVRSGAAFSMPGMMDTILNLGLNDASVAGLAEQTQNPTFAFDSYRRFIQMFADVVKSVPRIHFESILDTVKNENGYAFDNQLTLADLTDLVAQYKAVYQRETGESFPQEPLDQLHQAVQAVFSSWNNERAILYREIHDISHNLGTAVTVQSMVFGNRGNDSGTGVAFTRNPATGEKKLFGEFLMNAQGEDVVAGIRTPLDIDTLEEVMPAVYNEFKGHRRKTGGPLRRYAGHRVHDRKRQIVPAADPQRETDSSRSRRSGSGFDRRRTDHERRSHYAHRNRPVGQIAPPYFRHESYG